MWEFEIVYKGTNNHDFLYGYNEKDLIRRYPHISPDVYIIIYKEYID